jgi:hypothetical protein
MLLDDFSDRAEECMRLANRATSEHDRKLFTEMANAWYGMMDDRYIPIRSPARPQWSGYPWLANIRAAPPRTSQARCADANAAPSNAVQAAGAER